MIPTKSPARLTTGLAIAEVDKGERAEKRNDAWATPGDGAPMQSDIMGLSVSYQIRSAMTLSLEPARRHYAFSRTETPLRRNLPS